MREKPKTKRDVNRWLETGEYLPPPLRDFHDQKRVFKYVGQIEARRPIKAEGWIARHVYTVDYFLWFMARCGWTLQRSRQPVAFDDLETKLAELEEAELEVIRRAINEAIKERKANDASRTEPATSTE